MIRCAVQTFALEVHEQEVLRPAQLLENTFLETAERLLCYCYVRVKAKGCQSFANFFSYLRLVRTLALTTTYEYSCAKVVHIGRR